MSERRPSQVTVRDLAGHMLARWGWPDPLDLGSYVCAHDWCVDRHGDLYVGEIDVLART